MKQRGWDVVLYVLKDSPMEEIAREKSLTINHINRHRKYFDFIEALKLLQKIKKDGIDIVFIRDTRDIGLIALAKTLSGGKLKLIYQQAMQIGVNKRDLFHTLRYSKIDAWLTPLHWLAEQVKTRTRYPAGKIHIVPKGIELEKFIHKKHSKQKARDMLSLSSDARILGIIGRIEQGKGQHFLIEAVNHLNSLDCHVELLITGEPTKNEGTEYLDYLHKLIGEYNLNDKVHFRPFTDDVETFYCSIDIFTLASRAETYGTVTIEAMASGLPIIATNTGGTPEILKNGELGLLYPPGDIEAFSKNVIDLLDNPTKMIELGERAKKEAIERYSHESESKLIEEIIDRVCS